MGSNATIRAAFVVAPTYRFDGDDGEWSTFAIEVGTPAQSFRVLPATVGEEIWVPLPGGCQGSLSSNQDCGDMRGVDNAANRGFLYNESSTWSQTAGDPYQLMTEGDLFVDTGVYGTDTVALGCLSDEGYGSAMPEQTIAGVTTADFWLGNVGLGTSPGTFMQGSSTPSLMESMKTQNITPSLSFGYTAGQSYGESYGSKTQT
jgi:hypothetical protein